MKISGHTKMCIIIGDPIDHTLSPLMHNAAYEALGIDNEFVYTAAQVVVKDIEKVVEAVRVMNIRGLTCTIPHKIEIMKYLDEIDDIAKKIGAVNTVVNDNGTLKGYNTDWLGVVVPLEKKIGDLAKKKVGLIGAGGAARAIAYGVVQKGARLTIYNRTIDKAKELARETGAMAKEMSCIEEIEADDIIINSTSLGMGEQSQFSPLFKSLIRPRHIVFDIVYVPYETELLKDAKGQGAAVIHGTEMLLYQGIAQFELYTGRKAPEEVMRKSLYKYLKI